MVVPPVLAGATAFGAKPHQRRRHHAKRQGPATSAPPSPPSTDAVAMSQSVSASPNNSGSQGGETAVSSTVQTVIQTEYSTVTPATRTTSSSPISSTTLASVAEQVTTTSLQSVVILTPSEGTDIASTPQGSAQLLPSSSDASSSTLIASSLSSSASTARRIIPTARTGTLSIPRSTQSITPSQTSDASEHQPISKGILVTIAVFAFFIAATVILLTWRKIAASRERRKRRAGRRHVQIGSPLEASHSRTTNLEDEKKSSGRGDWDDKEHGSDDSKTDESYYHEPQDPYYSTSGHGEGLAVPPVAHTSRPLTVEYGPPGLSSDGTPVGYGWSDQYYYTAGGEKEAEQRNFRTVYSPRRYRWA